MHSVQKEYGMVNLLLVRMHFSLELVQVLNGSEVFSAYLVPGPGDLSECPHCDHLIKVLSQT